MANLSFANSLYLRFLDRDATDEERQVLSKEIDDKKQDDSDYDAFDATSDFVANKFELQHTEKIEQFIQDYYKHFSASPSLEALLDWTDDQSDLSSDEVDELKSLVGFDSYAEQLYVLDNPLDISSEGALSSNENESLDYTVSATGADQDDIRYSLNYSLDDDSHLFTIDAKTGELSFIDLPDFEEKKLYKLTVFVTDKETSLDSYQEVVIKINDVQENAAPQFTSDSAANADEDSTQVFYTARASDEEQDPLTFSINNLSDKDNNLFTINESTGNLAFKEAQDFVEGGDNLYLLDISVTDGFTQVTQELSVTLKELSDPILKLSALDGSESLTLIEGELANYKISLASGKIQAGETLTFTLDALNGVGEFGAVNPEDFSNFIDLDTASYTYTNTFEQAVVAGEDIFLFSLATEEDNLFEETEAFSINLHTASVADESVVVEGSPFTTEIENKRIPELTLSAADGGDSLTVTEGDLANYKISLSRGTIQAGETLSFTLDAINGDGEFGAVNPEDFSNFIDLDTASYTYTRTFEQAVAAGEEIFAFSLATEEDNLAEETEAFSIVLDDVSLDELDVTQQGSPLTTFIDNKVNNYLFTLSGDSTSVEGSTANYNIHLLGDDIFAGDSVELILETADGSALNPNDFSDLSAKNYDPSTKILSLQGPITANGNAAIAVLSVNIENDVFFENQEDFDVVLVAARVNGQLVNISGTPTTTVIVANDFDISAPVIEFGQSGSYFENSASNDVLLSVQASDATTIVGDAESGVASFQISTGNANNYFQIDNSGNISLSSTGFSSLANDFEVLPNSFTLGISASDAVGNVSSVTDVSLEILDVLDTDIEAPVIELGQSASYDENSALTDILLTVLASDVTSVVDDIESGVASFQINTGNTDNYFQIDNSGNISLTSMGFSSLANDFEVLPNSFTLGIIASDVAGNASSVTDVALELLDVVGGDESYILTVGLDDFGGTDLADTYIADNTVNQVSQLTDRLDGGLGIDTLEMTVNSIGGLIFPGTMTSIERININGSGLELFEDIDTSLVPSMTELALSSFNVFNNRVISLANNQILSLASVSGSASSALTVAQDGLVNSFDLNIAAVDNLQLNLAGSALQTLNLFASGTSNLTLQQTGAGLNRLNISANQPISFNQSVFNAQPFAEGDTLLNIDASASSASVTMETDFNSHILDIVGGSGDDHFDMEEGDAFDGGQGVDTAHFSSSVLGEVFFGEVFNGAVTAAVVGGAMLDSSLINVERVLISDGIENTFNFSQQSEDLIFEVFNSDLIELIAGSGNDTLIASVGEELLEGGLGADEFSMNFPGTAVSFGQDIMTDFTVAEGDQLDLDGAGTQAKNISGLSQVQLVGNGSRANEEYIANTELVLIDNSAPDVISVASFTS
ncbi:MAG: hypothetical protein GQ582_00670, partial [Methyloprofundus sp.]|nr:hypothetical protein [Methyloprofundus sp.]